jgi:hypothetical protein
LVTRLTAAVLATAAVAITIAGIAVSAALDEAVRAEVAIAAKGHPLDVARIRIIDGLSPGQSYRLPSFGVRNHRGIRTAYRLVASADAMQPERRPSRRWLRFVPPAVVIDAGRSRAVGVRLELPDDAEPGVYTVLVGVRPGGSEGARLAFRIEPAERERAWLRQPANLAMWVVSAFVGAVLVVVVVRVGGMKSPGSKRAANVEERLGSTTRKQAARAAKGPCIERFHANRRPSS